MNYMDIACMEISDIEKSAICNSDIYYLESGDSEGLLQRVKNAIKKIVDKLVEAINKLIHKPNKDIMKAAARDIPELKSEKIEISDPNKRDAEYKKCMDECNNAETPEDMEKAKKRLINFNAKTTLITVGAATAITLCLTILPKRIKTFNTRSEVAHKVEVEAMNTANRKNGKIDAAIETLQKEYGSKIDTIKKSDLDEDKKKEQITHLKCELDRKLERVKGISVPRYDSAEEKAYQHIKIMSKFSQEEMKALNETETSVMHMIRNFAQEHGYVYDRNKNKFIKVVTKTLADDMKGDVIAE